MIVRISALIMRVCISRLLGILCLLPESPVVTPWDEELSGELARCLRGLVLPRRTSHHPRRRAGHGLRATRELRLRQTGRAMRTRSERSLCYTAVEPHLTFSKSGQLLSGPHNNRWTLVIPQHQSFSGVADPFPQRLCHRLSSASLH